MSEKMVNLDGNEAAAYIAYQLSEVMAIYPITPSSTMGEFVDQWSTLGDKNIWNTTPKVVEMQSEGGAAGTVHGSLQAGTLSSTFTASQGLLLMIPNMYKIAGELSPCVFHVAARSLAYQGLSIFGDHSDIMATRQTGFAMLGSNSVQESMDMALVSHISSLKTRLPFMHFFDGFRTSHEVSKIHKIPKSVISKMVDDKLIFENRSRALTPDRPMIRGTAQNPDVYFQGREVANTIYAETPDTVQETMDELAKHTGREYKLFEYHGAKDAEKLIIIMGSGADAVHETVDYLLTSNEKVGVLKVRLFRPFSLKHFSKYIPTTISKVAVLDRTKESGSVGEPLYQDIVTAFAQLISQSKWPMMPQIIGGRYGLSSKEFTPAMIMSIYKELDKTDPKNSFTIGINDDVTFTSLDYDKSFNLEKDNTFRGIFWGMGSDGTVSANKNSIKIIGDETENFAQGYFVYDSKKSGSITNSHLRFGKDPIRSSYLVEQANFIAAHSWNFVEKFDVLGKAEKGATFLLNSIYSKDEVWDELPMSVQETIIEKKINLYVINAYRVARKTGMGSRINTIMQTCFFAISGILPQDEAIEKIKKSIHKTFSKKGDEVVQKNYVAVDQTLENLFKVDLPGRMTSNIPMISQVSDDAPDYIKDVTATMLAMKGDDIPVSKMSLDGTFPTGTTKFEKRNLSQDVPAWDSDICIQCSKCANVCPHAAIRVKAYGESELKDSPGTFKSIKMKGKYEPGTMYTVQVAVEDCTGCQICVDACPAKSKTEPGKKAINMTAQLPIRKAEKENWDFFQGLSYYDRAKLNTKTVKDSQLLEPLFEFSGACTGCGETPYIKLATQLYGDRMLIANATGCSSIYGGNLPTTPYTKNNDGLGPAWSNSLFEDNAEFGLGMRLAVDRKLENAKELLSFLSDKIGTDLVQNILENKETDELQIRTQREYIAALKSKLEKLDSSEAKHLLSLADYLSKKSVWIIGGDGWAYDIGYGGLDHVVASGENVNILILDTEVYSNTGGQMSKATPTGAVAKFAAAGKPIGKKDLALQAMSYETAYVAKICMGANDAHTLKAIKEAESYEGTSIIIAYSPCIAHGYDLKDSLVHQKAAVESGHWHLFRYDPRRTADGKNPFQLDSKAPKTHISDYMNRENRFKALNKMDPQRAKDLAAKSQMHNMSKWKFYSGLANMHGDE